jgi:hypothetical protein
MKALQPFQITVTSTQCHIPEDWNVHQPHCKHADGGTNLLHCVLILSLPVFIGLDDTNLKQNILFVVNISSFQILP